MADPVSPAPAQDFASLIDKMPDDLFSQLCTNISQVTSPHSKVNAAFKNPYPDPNSDNFLQFKKFLEANDITILSANNAKIFEVKPKNGDPAYIVKLNKDTGPVNLDAIERMNKQLPGTLVKNQISKNVTIDKDANYRLIVMNATGVDLETLFDKKLETYEKRRDLALPIFTQMSSLLLKMQAEGVYFANSQNSNWQYNNGKLQLAHTKSLRLTDRPGSDYPLTHSKSPPEFANRTSNSAVTSAESEKALVFVMANNMLEAFTGEKIRRDPSVTTTKGNIPQLLEKLKQKDPEMAEFLTKCLNYAPDKRPALKDVQNKLLEFNIDRLSKEKDPSDLTLQTFLLSAKKNLSSYSDEEKKQLSDKLDQLSNNPQVLKIEALIKNLEQEQGVFLSSGQNKAEKIKKAYYGMSIEQRLSSEDKDWKTVLDALQEKRFLTTSSSFKTFKATLEKAKQVTSPSTAPEVANEPHNSPIKISKR